MLKKMICLTMSAGMLIPAQAQLFSSEAMGGALLGGVAGGIIGHNSGRHAGAGIAIGAGAGLLVGAMVHESRRPEPVYYYSSPAPTYVYASAPVVYAPAPVYVAPRPNYAVTGAIVGGIAGGVIGHNSHHRTLAGIGIGAGAGLLIGSLAEAEARRRERVVVQYAPAAPVMTQPAVEAAPPVQTQQPAPIVSQSYTSNEPKPSSMNGVNTLFGR